MSDGLYGPDENKYRAEVRYQQARSRLVELGNEISSRPRTATTVTTTSSTAAAVASRERLANDEGAPSTSLLRPAKRRRMSFPKTGLFRY